MSTPDARVRVTLEGAVQHSVRDQQVLRFRTVRDTGEPGPLVLIDTRWQGVTVETLPPEWEWSEGDVVAGEHIVYRRKANGVWIGNAGTPGLTYDVDDSMVSAAAGKRGGYDVLRYRAGGVGV